MSPREEAEMELRHLRYFVAIAEEQSFTRAAERLWIAQPGLSTQMRRLEAELGVQLLERHSRGIDLTQAGELFLERARVALAATDMAAATGRDLQAGVIGTVRLGVSSGPGWPSTSELLGRFSGEWSGVELSVLQGYGATLSRDLRDGRLDALLTPSGSAGAGMKALDLGSAEWVVLIGTGHPLAGIGPVAAWELEGERIAVTGHRDAAAYDRAVTDVLGTLGVTAELVPGAPWPAVHAAIAGNELLAFTTAPDALPKGVIARTLNPRQTLSFELVWRDETPSPALAGFVDAAAAHAQRQPSIRALAAVA
jgi:DNA-binding transcriptional LysR family regulator